jgi:p21-activated kinase 1
MSSPQSAINQRSFSNQQRRQSKITVEYHRPSRESIQEYNALLAESNLHAAEAAKYATFIPSRQAPAPPQPSPVRSKTPTEVPLPLSSPRVRNSLQKPNPRARKHSLTSATARIPEHDPFAANTTSTIDSLAQVVNRNGMTSSTSPPPRPSRANTATLNDIFPTPGVLAARRLSSPASAPTGAVNDDSHFYADPSEALPSGPSSEYTNSNNPTPIHTPTLGNRSRSATTVKSKKGVLGFMSEVFNPTKRPEISTPYDPVHLTHVGFNSSTGEFTGLPKEWQQLLQESGISRSDQEKNPQAVMEIVKFYQEGRGDVWDKLGAMGGPTDPSYRASNIDESLQNPVRSLQ